MQTTRVEYAPIMKLLKAFLYVRQRTLLHHAAYVRSRSVGVLGGCTVLALAACNSNTATTATPGLVTIQTAVTCPAPPAHTAVTNPPRHFAAAPKLTLAR